MKLLKFFNSAYKVKFVCIYPRIHFVTRSKLLKVPGLRTPPKMESLHHRLIAFFVESNRHHEEWNIRKCLIRRIRNKNQGFIITLLQAGMPFITRHRVLRQPIGDHLAGSAAGGGEPNLLRRNPQGSQVRPCITHHLPISKQKGPASRAHFMSKLAWRLVNAFRPFRARGTFRTSGNIRPSDFFSLCRSPGLFRLFRFHRTW